MTTQGRGRTVGLPARSPLGRLMFLRYKWFEAAVQARLAAQGWPGLTEAQSAVISCLGLTGTRPAEVARRMGVSRQSAHVSIRDLDAMGLVVLVPDLTNRRANLARLTEHGRAISAAAQRAYDEAEQGVARRAGPAHAAALRAALEADWGTPATAARQKRAA